MQSYDGTPLFVTDSLIGSASSAGGIVLMHGLGEHSGRYLRVVQFLNACGWSVRAFDHRGHGRSGGARGDVPASDAILRDAKILIDDFTQQIGSPPLLFGHSMGGLFAARFATGQCSPLSGLILSSPPLALPLTTVQSILFKVLKTVAPGLAISTGLKSRWVSHDPIVVAACESDPLVHSKISARLLGSMLDAVNFCMSHTAALHVPTLMLIAGDDHIVDSSGSTHFFQKLAEGVGMLHTYPNFYHEVLNEMNAQCVFDDLRAWLMHRAPSVTKTS